MTALVVAAPSSGSGKTVVTLGLMRHLRRQGMRIASAKVGPDYIDPPFHAAATGRPSINLDPWAMREATLRRLAVSLAQDAELIVCEGAMGLFDGPGSTADLAALFGWPVVLVIDISGQGASAAALLRGFATHRRGVTIAGVILNRAGSERHARLVTEAIAAASPGIPVLGAVPRDGALALPQRHLGLVQADEHPQLDSFLDRAADAVGQAVDVASLIRVCTGVGHRRDAPSPSKGENASIAPLGRRIAIARDVAFAFIYPSLLRDWREAGAELSFFSPLADQAPAEDADAVYLPGGYPELHAETIAAASRFLGGLRAAGARGAAVYGECGGYMVLGTSITDARGRQHRMAGLLPVATSFAERRLHLGYRHTRLLSDAPLGEAGTRFRGHEFHYATILEEGPGEPVFEVADAEGRNLGRAGLRSGTILGSFVHLVDLAARSG